MDPSFFSMTLYNRYARKEQNEEETSEEPEDEHVEFGNPFLYNFSFWWDWQQFISSLEHGNFSISSYG